MKRSHPFTIHEAEKAHNALKQYGWKLSNRQDGIAVYSKGEKRICVDEDVRTSTVNWNTGAITNRGGNCLEAFLRSPNAYDSYIKGSKEYAKYMNTAKDDPQVDPPDEMFILNSSFESELNARIKNTMDMQDMDMNAMSASPVPDSSQQQDAPPTVGLGNCEPCKPHGMKNCKECGCGTNSEHSDQSKHIRDVKSMFQNSRVADMSVKPMIGGHEKEKKVIQNCMNSNIDPDNDGDMHNNISGKGVAPEVGKHDAHHKYSPHDMGNKVLTAAARHHLSKKSFALPGRRYPIHDASHARNALARVSQYGTPAEKAKVRAAVHRKYPNIGNRMEEIIVERLCNAGNSQGVKKSWMKRRTAHEHAHQAHLHQTEATAASIAGKNRKAKHHADMATAHANAAHEYAMNDGMPMHTVHAAHYAHSSARRAHADAGAAGSPHSMHHETWEAHHHNQMKFLSEKYQLHNRDNPEGRIGKEGFQHPTDGHTCDKCNSTGDCAKCKGTGICGEEVCPMCTGSGNCEWCEGHNTPPNAVRHTYKHYMQANSTDHNRMNTPNPPSA